MINLLYRTSFTTQPRVITCAISRTVVQARVADLVEALRDAKNNERLIFCKRSPNRGSIPNDSPDVREQKLSSGKSSPRVQEQKLFANGLTKQAADRQQQGFRSAHSCFGSGISFIDHSVELGIEGRCATEDRAVLQEMITRVP